MGRRTSVNQLSVKSIPKPANRIFVCLTTEGKTHQNVNIVGDNMGEKIEIVVRVIEGIFFVLTGVIALLTYLSAKKTVLQPIKTEVFKYQVEVFSKIMNLFNGKSEHELRKIFGFDEMLRANIIQMVDCYASVFFQWKIDGDERPYNKRDCPASIITFEYAKRYMIEPGLRYNNIKKSKESEIGKSKEDVWAEYLHGEICEPKKTVDMLLQLDEILQSPFLTKESIRLLQEIKDSILDNMTQIGTVLTEVAKELPYLYPNAEELQQIDIGWIENRYNQVFDPLDTYCVALTDYLREYFKVETVMK